MKKNIIISAVICLAFIFCGCGNTDKLDVYYDGMTTFNGNVQIITETLELIDVDKASAANQVSDQLDKLVEQFKILSELEVPKDFNSCKDLSADAYSYMVEADRLYKQWADDPDNADIQLVSMAKENYNRAMKRVNYISIILQGGVPEGEGVTITEEEITDFNPVVDDYDDSNVDVEIENIEDVDVETEIENVEEDEFGYE